MNILADARDFVWAVVFSYSHSYHILGIVLKNRETLFSYFVVYVSHYSNEVLSISHHSLKFPQTNFDIPKPYFKGSFEKS